MKPSRLVFGSGLMAVALSSTAAHAEQVGVDTSTSSSDLPAAQPNRQGGAVLAAGKAGGIVQFNGLSPFVHGALELGYVFGGMGRSLGAYLGVEYTAPKSDGTVTESDTPARIPAGTYDWELRQKELVLQPTFLYRFTWLEGMPVVPYAGIGPRVFLLESVVRGSAGGQVFEDTKETSTKFGVGLPLGVEYPLGPGGLLAEVLVQWAPLDHTTTGDTHLGGTSLFLGYRALL